ncbi:hypothetical protein ACFX2C_009695 [Malus domestica]
MQLYCWNLAYAILWGRMPRFHGLLLIRVILYVSKRHKLALLALKPANRRLVLLFLRSRNHELVLLILKPRRHRHILLLLKPRRCGLVLLAVLKPKCRGLLS